MNRRAFILPALLALLPLLASAAGTATVRVTNSGKVPITVAGQTIRPSATATIPVPAGEAGALDAAAPDGFGISAPAAYPSLRAGATFSLRLAAERGASAAAPVPVAPAVPAGTIPVPPRAPAVPAGTVPVPPRAPAPPPARVVPRPVQGPSHAEAPLPGVSATILLPGGVPLEMVRLPNGVWAGRYEVTQAQWESVMGPDAKGWVEKRIDEERIEEHRPGFRKFCPIRPDNPVTFVSWDDCQDFLRAINALRLDGSRLRFRLPTEPEWKVAAAAGGNPKGFGLLPNGSEATVEEVCWHACNSDALHRVGELLPNAYGLFDITGNVSEWTSTPAPRNPGWWACGGNAFHSIPPIDVTVSERGGEKSDARFPWCGFRLFADGVVSVRSGTMPTPPTTTFPPPPPTTTFPPPPPTTTFPPPPPTPPTTTFPPPPTTTFPPPPTTTFPPPPTTTFPLPPRPHTTTFPPPPPTVTTTTMRPPSAATTTTQTSVPPPRPRIVRDWRRWTHGDAVEIPFAKPLPDVAPEAEGMVYVKPQWNRGTDPASESAYSRFSGQGFFIDRTEVTLARWQAVKAWGEGHGYAFACDGNGEGPDHPVTRVTWMDCAKWCNARSEMEGRTPCYRRKDGSVWRGGEGGPDRPAEEDDPPPEWIPEFRPDADGYRLPLLSEWEIAARGGVSGDPYPTGPSESFQMANYDWHGGHFGDIRSEDNITFDVRRLFLWSLEKSHGDHPVYGNDPYSHRMAPVGRFPPNPYGLFDLSGNASEWLGNAEFATVGHGKGWVGLRISDSEEYGHANRFDCILYDEMRLDPIDRFPAGFSPAGNGVGFRTVRAAPGKAESRDRFSSAEEVVRRFGAEFARAVENDAAYRSGHDYGLASALPPEASGLRPADRLGFLFRTVSDQPLYAAEIDEIRRLFAERSDPDGTDFAFGEFEKARMEQLRDAEIGDLLGTDFASFVHPAVRAEFLNSGAARMKAALLCLRTLRERSLPPDGDGASRSSGGADWWAGSASSPERLSEEELRAEAELWLEWERSLFPKTGLLRLTESGVPMAAYRIRHVLPSVSLEERFLVARDDDGWRIVKYDLFPFAIPGEEGWASHPADYRDQSLSADAAAGIGKKSRVEILGARQFCLRGEPRTAPVEPAARQEANPSSGRFPVRKKFLAALVDANNAAVAADKADGVLDPSESPSKYGAIMAVTGTLDGLPESGYRATTLRTVRLLPSPESGETVAAYYLTMAGDSRFGVPIEVAWEAMRNRVPCIAFDPRNRLTILFGETGDGRYGYSRPRDTGAGDVVWDPVDEGRFGYPFSFSDEERAATLEMAKGTPPHLIRPAPPAGAVAATTTVSVENGVEWHDDSVLPEGSQAANRSVPQNDGVAAFVERIVEIEGLHTPKIVESTRQGASDKRPIAERFRDLARMMDARCREYEALASSLDSSLDDRFCRALFGVSAKNRALADLFSNLADAASAAGGADVQRMTSIQTRMESAEAEARTAEAELLRAAERAGVDTSALRIWWAGAEQAK